MINVSLVVLGMHHAFDIAMVDADRAHQAHE